MKLKDKLCIIFILFGAFGVAHANGREGANGGDICEDRFKIVRDDISKWLDDGGAVGLTFPSGVALDTYKTGMLKEISAAQISCVDDKIMIDNTEKTCKNFSDSKGVPQIVCNSKRFMGTEQSDQYILVHHEYAGLAGFEVNTGADSNYSISNQISAFLVDAVVKKLAVSPAPSSGVQQSKPLLCNGLLPNGAAVRNYSLNLDATTSSGILTITEVINSRESPADVVGLRQLDSSLPDGNYTLTVRGEINCSFDPQSSPPAFYCGAVSDSVNLIGILRNNGTGAETSYNLTDLEVDGSTLIRTGFGKTSQSTEITLGLSLKGIEGLVLFNTFAFDEGETDGLGCVFIK